MPFEQGKSKTGGRAVGVQNHSTTNLKSKIEGKSETKRKRKRGKEE